jgi:hypothetical protein
MGAIIRAKIGVHNEEGHNGVWLVIQYKGGLGYWNIGVLQYRFLQYRVFSISGYYNIGFLQYGLLLQLARVLVI